MECIEDKKNLSVNKCVKLPSLPLCMITTPLNATIPAATLADAALLEAFIQAKLIAPKAERWYLWPLFKGFEDNSEGAIYEDTALADIKVRDGKYRFRFMLQEALCLHKAMFSHRSSGSTRVLVYDIENQLTLTLNSAGDGLGLTVSLLNTEKLKISDGSVATKSPIYVVLANNKELDKDGAVVDASFVNTLQRLTDVTITVLTAAAGLITLTVKTSCDGTDVSGLALADFVVTNNAGATIVVSARTETNGVYSLTQAGNLFIDGFVDIVAANALTVVGYESTGKAIVNIP